jgi:zinc transporter ZupT
MSTESTANDEENNNNNVGIAFALTFGAGAATALGAAVVFIPWAVKYANRKTLAASLGLSAGVMTYVSYVEIFQKSIASFLESGMTTNEAYRYATICFFGGVVFMVVSVLTFDGCCVARGRMKYLKYLLLSAMCVDGSLVLTVTRCEHFCAIFQYIRFYTSY